MRALARRVSRGYTEAMKLAPLFLLLALPALSQVRSAPPYEGTAPGHPADEPGPELGSSAEDAFTLLSRGDRDAARLSAARCLRSDDEDHGCRLVAAAVEADIDVPRLPASGLGRARADVHFRAGADYYLHDELASARREWEVCRRLDPGYGFCALGLKLAALSPGDRATAPSPRSAVQRPARRSGRIAVPGDMTK